MYAGPNCGISDFMTGHKLNEHSMNAQNIRNIRALIVEDNDDMRDLMKLLLEEAGYETLAAADGRAALKHIENDHEFIDLVITDVQMPEVTGHEILAAVRARRGETPVIVITAFGSVEQAVGMVKAGAFQYLTKPFNKEKLLGLVAKALESSAPRREQARLRRELPSTSSRIIGASNRYASYSNRSPRRRAARARCSSPANRARARNSSPARFTTRRGAAEL